MARFDPIWADIAPKMKVPTIAPKLLIELIHDSSALDIAPVTKGVSSERRTGKAGDNHPTQHP